MTQLNLHINGQIRNLWTIIFIRQMFFYFL